MSPTSSTFCNRADPVPHEKLDLSRDRDHRARVGDQGPFRVRERRAVHKRHIRAEHALPRKRSIWFGIPNPSIPA